MLTHFKVVDIRFANIRKFSEICFHEFLDIKKSIKIHTSQQIKATWFLNAIAVSGLLRRIFKFDVID